jgi:hypothetical protein
MMKEENSLERKIEKPLKTEDDYKFAPITPITPIKVEKFVSFH